MGARQELSNPNVLAVKTGESVSTIRRIANGIGNARIDSIDVVARAFRLRACDLLDPSLAERVGKDPDLKISQPRPPITTQDEWRALTPAVRALVEELMLAAASGALPDDRARHLQQTLAMLAQAPAEHLPPRPTPEGAEAFERAAREAEQHATTHQRKGRRP